jgi:hypothetical protein
MGSVGSTCADYNRASTLAQLDRAIFENSSDLHAVLFLAAFALPDRASLEEIIFL